MEDADSQSVEDCANEFWTHVEGMIDREIERVHNNQDLAVPPLLLDRYSFAIQMYIIGNVKGTVGTLLTCVADDTEDMDPLDVDLSPIYERIVEAVQDREDEIRSGMKQSDAPDDVEPST